MTTQARSQTLPRGTLLLAGGLVLSTLAMTATARLTGTPPAASPVLLRSDTAVAPVTSRMLAFADRADGAVVITDATTGQIAHVVAAGQKTGFIRGVMRGLARERRMRGVGAGAPFKLTLWRDGELSLDDTVTGRSIELNAFGPTNREDFAQLLAPRA